MSTTLSGQRVDVRGDGLLLLTAAIWGFAFVAQRIGMEHVGPFTFNGLRFALGSLSLLPFLVRGGLSGLSGLGGIALAGVVLFIGASLQQFGLVYTTAGKAGFITGLYVVLVPLLGLFLRLRPKWSTWAGVVCGAVGLYLLSLTEELRLALGDGLVLASAFFWALHVLLIDRLVGKTGWVLLAMGQFAVCAFLSLLLALLIEDPTLAGLKGGAWPILYGGVLSVGVAYTLQVVAQRWAPPAHAALLLSLEAVFAAIGGWLLLGELLTRRELAGCVLMLAGMLFSQLGQFKKKRPADG